jgi:hypothetical protein
MEHKERNRSDTKVLPTRSVWSEIVDDALKEARKKVSQAERSEEESESEEAEPAKKDPPAKAAYSY